MNESNESTDADNAYFRLIENDIYCFMRNDETVNVEDDQKHEVFCFDYLTSLMNQGIASREHDICERLNRTSSLGPLLSIDMFHYFRSQGNRQVCQYQFKRFAVYLISIMLY